jgi:hypothetical protein
LTDQIGRIYSATSDETESQFHDQRLQQHSFGP